MILRDEGLKVRDGEVLNVECIDIIRKASPAVSRNFHYHKYHELIYVISGEFDTYIYDNEYRCKKDDTLLIFSNEPHTFFHKSDCRYIVIKFMPEILSTYEQSSLEFEYVYNMSNITREKERLIPNLPEIKELCLDAIRKFTEKEYGNELFIRADVTRACAHIIKHWYQNNDILRPSDKISGENIKLIRKVTDYAVREFGNIKMGEAAAMCGFSERHFSRLFKELIGLTFTEYIQTVRINEATRLLQCTDDTVTTIAQTLGYASSSHFIYDFKKAKGISPKKYASTRKI